MAIRISTQIVKVLTDRGLLPAHCRHVSLSIPPASAMILTFEVLVTDEHLDILADAFKAQAQLDRDNRV